MSIQCAACRNEIPADRFMEAKAYCACGMVTHFASIEPKPLINKNSRPIVVIFLLIVGLFIHVANWDTHLFSIVPLKAKQAIGMASVEDLKEIAKICHERKKATCELIALEEAFKNDKKEVEGLLRVANIQMSQRSFVAAAATYTAYFKNGGKDSESRYFYAQALGEIGNLKEAEMQFQYMLKTDKSSPNFKAARAYVDLLLRNKQYALAKNVIEHYRKTDNKSALFLSKELKLIEEQMKKRYLANTSN